jgi:CheY-like chemotaxis protein
MAKLSDYTNSRFNFSGDKPLIYPDDDPYTWELIKELIERKRFVRRESKYHLKHRKVNYFPSTEVITIDGRGRHPETGPDAFLELLDQLYPRRLPAKLDPLSLRDEEPQPSSLILDISLDDDDGLGACANHREDSEGDLEL